MFKTAMQYSSLLQLPLYVGLVAIKLVNGPKGMIKHYSSYFTEAGHYHTFGGKKRLSD